MNSNLLHRELTEQVIGVFYEVYNELGHGFLEVVYQRAMLIALRQRGLSAAAEVPVPVYFRSAEVGTYFADLVVNDTVLVELKSARALDRAHEAQLLHYLRATKYEVGFLFNFGRRAEFRRLLFDNESKKIRENPCQSVAEVLGV